MTTEEEINDYISSRQHSPRVQEQIDKLLKDEEAQKGRTFSYYQELRKKDQTKFLSTQLQKQMEQDAQDLGEHFFND